MSLTKKLAPMVDAVIVLKLLLTNRMAMLLLPTPDSPTSTTGD